MVGMLQFCFPCVSQDCMLSLFVMFKLFWVESPKQKTKLVCFLSRTEGA